jgi:hypothetical protein
VADRSQATPNLLVCRYSRPQFVIPAEELSWRQGRDAEYRGYGQAGGDRKIDFLVEGESWAKDRGTMCRPRQHPYGA